MNWSETWAKLATLYKESCEKSKANEELRKQKAEAQRQEEESLRQKVFYEQLFQLQLTNDQFCEIQESANLYGSHVTLSPKQSYDIVAHCANRAKAIGDTGTLKDIQNTIGDSLDIRLDFIRILHHTLYEYFLHNYYVDLSYQVIMPSDTMFFISNGSYCFRYLITIENQARFLEARENFKAFQSTHYGKELMRSYGITKAKIITLDNSQNLVIALQ